MRYRVTFLDFIVDSETDNEGDAYDLAVNFIDESPTDFLIVQSVEPIGTPSA